jgi:hypothetical protein
MTSFRQVEANQGNAFRSTPENRSWQAAVAAKCTSTRIDRRNRRCRSGRNYPASEAAIIVDYDARTAVERELVLRLASLVWHMRRVSAIETDLFLDPRDPERPPV